MNIFYILFSHLVLAFRRILQLFHVLFLILQEVNFKQIIVFQKIEVAKELSVVEIDLIVIVFIGL